MPGALSKSSKHSHPAPYTLISILWTRVQGFDHHEISREGDGAGCSGDGDLHVFEGLAQDFEGGAFGGEETTDAVVLGGFQCFLEAHGGHDGGEAFGEHRFSASRWADQEVVATGDGDFDGAFGGVLAAYVGEIDFAVGVDLFDRLGDDRSEGFVASQEFKDLSEVSDPVGGDAGDDGGFVGGFFRDHDGAFASAAGFEGDGKDAVDAPEGSIKDEFADKRVLIEVIKPDLFTDRDGAKCDREVEARAFLFHVGGGEIDGVPAFR